MPLNEEFKKLITLQLKSENNDLLILREYLVDYKNRGMDEESMYRNLKELSIDSDEEMQDILFELMDFVGGFCNPILRIF